MSLLHFQLAGLGANRDVIENNVIGSVIYEVCLAKL
jgi:hypothetical protein